MKQQHISDYKIFIEQDIDWGDMDAFGHINNILYIRYFENARINYFNKTSMMKDYPTTGVGPILAKVNCTFIFALTYPDLIKVGAKVTEFKQDRFVMDYLIHSTKENKAAAVGSSEIVMFNYRSNQKTSLSNQLKQEIESLEV